MSFKRELSQEGPIIQCPVLDPEDSHEMHTMISLLSIIVCFVVSPTSPLKQFDLSVVNHFFTHFQKDPVFCSCLLAVSLWIPALKSARPHHCKT